MQSNRYKNYTNILLHFVWGVQQESPILSNESMRQMLWETARQIGEAQGFKILCVGGHIDHLHLIVELGKNQKSARIAHTIQDMTATYFKKEFGLDVAWQESFLAVSIAKSQLPALSDYITKQEVLHSNKTFAEEYAELIEG